MTGATFALAMAALAQDEVPYDRFDACADGDGAACLEVAERFPDPKEALVYRKHACQIGSDTACTALERLDVQTALAACLAGAPTACSRLLEGADAFRTSPEMEALCEAGHRQACAEDLQAAIATGPVVGFERWDLQGGYHHLLPFDDGVWLVGSDRLVALPFDRLRPVQWAPVRASLSPEGHTLRAVDGKAGIVRAWDVRTGKLETLGRCLAMPPFQASARCDVWSRDGRELARGEGYRVGGRLWVLGKDTLWILDPAPGAAPLEHALAARERLMGQDAQRVYTVSPSELIARDARTGAVLWRAPEAGEEVAPSEDGRWLAVAGFRGLWLLDPQTGARRYHAQLLNIRDLAWAGGDLLLSTSDAVVRLQLDGQGAALGAMPALKVPAAFRQGLPRPQRVVLTDPPEELSVLYEGLPLPRAADGSYTLERVERESSPARLALVYQGWRLAVSLQEPEDGVHRIAFKPVALVLEGCPGAGLPVEILKQRTLLTDAACAVTLPRWPEGARLHGQAQTEEAYWSLTSQAVETLVVPRRLKALPTPSPSGVDAFGMPSFTEGAGYSLKETGPGGERTVKDTVAVTFALPEGKESVWVRCTRGQAVREEYLFSSRPSSPRGSLDLTPGRWRVAALHDGKISLSTIEVTAHLPEVALSFEQPAPVITGRLVRRDGLPRSGVGVGRGETTDLAGRFSIQVPDPEGLYELSWDKTRVRVRPGDLGLIRPDQQFYAPLDFSSRETPYGLQILSSKAAGLEYRDTLIAACGRSLAGMTQIDLRRWLYQQGSCSATVLHPDGTTAEIGLPLPHP